MHQWQREEDGAPWRGQLTVKGHFGAVSDMDWDEHNLSLFTTSLDQTTRIFSEHTSNGSWYEIGRPQVHGYDMNTLCTVKTLNSDKDIQRSSRLLSGGDEKVLRLFESPYNYVKSMNNLNPRLRQEQKYLHHRL